MLNIRETVEKSKLLPLSDMEINKLIIIKQKIPDEAQQEKFKNLLEKLINQNYEIKKGSEGAYNSLTFTSVNYLKWLFIDLIKILESTTMEEKQCNESCEWLDSLIKKLNFSQNEILSSPESRNFEKEESSISKQSNQALPKEKKPSSNMFIQAITAFMSPATLRKSSSKPVSAMSFSAFKENSILNALEPEL